MPKDLLDRERDIYYGSALPSKKSATVDSDFLCDIMGHQFSECWEGVGGMRALKRFDIPTVPTVFSWHAKISTSFTIPARHWDVS